MIKLIVAVRKRPEMSAEEFQDHWRTHHARLVKNNPATLKYVRKYVQCHTMLAEYQRGDVAYDGTAELWFDTVQDKDAFFSDPDYLKNVQPDESRFADMTQDRVLCDRGRAHSRQYAGVSCGESRGQNT